MFYNFSAALDQADVKQQFPISNKDQSIANKKNSTTTKLDNSEPSLLHNGLSSLLSKPKHSPESMQTRNEIECQAESIEFENNKTSIPTKEDLPNGAARLKITPLKGLSSSLKPRMLKSIGIQVGPDKW